MFFYTLTILLFLFKIHGEKKTKNISLFLQEKFGEIMAMNGGRIYSLNDEMASFFSTCSIFMQTKGANNQPTNQLDFLSLFNGGSKRRETGNNYYYGHHAKIILAAEQYISYLFTIYKIRCMPNLS